VYVCICVLVRVCMYGDFMQTCIDPVLHAYTFNGMKQYLRIHMCVCVCVCVYIYIYIYIYIYMYICVYVCIYIYVCVCVCVCICKRALARASNLNVAQISSYIHT
jgi:hypothetical protein